MGPDGSFYCLNGHRLSSFIIKQPLNSLSSILHKGSTRRFRQHGPNEEKILRTMQNLSDAHRRSTEFYLNLFLLFNPSFCAAPAIEHRDSIKTLRAYWFDLPVTMATVAASLAPFLFNFCKPTVLFCVFCILKCLWHFWTSGGTSDIGNKWHSGTWKQRGGEKQASLCQATLTSCKQRRGL